MTRMDVRMCDKAVVRPAGEYAWLVDVVRQWSTG